MLSFIFSFADEHLNLDWKITHLKDGKWWVFRQYTEFYNDLLCKAQKKITLEEIYVIKCTSCHNETFDVNEEKCLVCGHSEDVLECKWCKGLYIFLSCEYGEEAQLCPSCEWKDGYAAANCEKY